MSEADDLDRRVLRSITGRDRLKALLSEGGLSLTDFARKYNHWVTDVSRCIGGDRPLPEIRDDLAEELDLTREQVDQMIEVASKT